MGTHGSGLSGGLAHEDRLFTSADGVPCRRAGRRRASGERGAALVEAALIMPLLILVVFGVLEAGYAFFGRLTINNMSVVGARQASGQANEVLADYRIVQSVGDASSSMSPSTINLIVVFKASGPGDSVPTACKANSLSGTCNRYTGASLSLAEDQFGCTGPPGPTVKLDSYWCPTSRKTALTGANGPPDYIGVYIEGVHTNLVGFWGQSFTFSSTNVMRIEPRTLR